jgi:hypothetical protein
MIAFKDFDLRQYLQAQAPEKDGTYLSFGLFSLISTLTSMYFLDDKNHYLIIFFYQSVLTLSVMFITYPIWPPTIRNTNILPMVWCFAPAYMLVIVGTFMLLVGGFKEIQLIAFMANLLVIAILLEWKLALLTIGFGVYIGFDLYIKEYGYIRGDMGTTQFKILYILLGITASLIGFIRPKYHKIKHLEKTNYNLEELYANKSYDLVRAFFYKEEFIGRLDKNCIEVFANVGNNINELSSKLEIQPSFDDLRNITNQVALIVEKLKDGSEYLNGLINSLKQIKLDIGNSNLHNIIEKQVGEDSILIQSQLQNSSIICDEAKIAKSLKVILDHARRNTNNEISLSIESSMIDYDLSFINEYQETIPSYKITISIISNKLTDEDISKLLNSKLKTEEEVSFAQIANIINAHYGRFLINNNNNNVKYIIELPVNVKDVRPKVVDLIDHSDLEINQIYKTLDLYEKATLNKMAIRLYREGMELKKITEITQLSNSDLDKLLKTL